MRFLKSLLVLFYPDLCISCHKTLVSNETLLCLNCRHDLPVIDIQNPTDNEIVAAFYEKFPIKKAVAFLWFRKHNSTQKLIHQFKYKNNPKIGTVIGNWFGHQLKEKGFFNDVDCIVPVPLHPKKLKKRGYNQAAVLGRELSAVLNIEYVPDILVRSSYTQTQTRKHRYERFLNLKTAFYLTDKTVFKNKHVLVIDDVITTGATIEACCNELLKTENITISIATMAYTEHL